MRKDYTIFLHQNILSELIIWRNKVTSVTPENSWGINCVILEAQR